MSWYWYLALKQLFPTGRYVSFFTLVSVMGVFLGVMVLIIVQSVMNGFAHEIESKIIDTNGDIRIEAGGIIYDWEPLLKEIYETKGVLVAAPYAQGIVMLQYQGRPTFPYVRGIDMDPQRQVVPIESYLLEGDIYDLDDESLLLSSQLAYSLGVDIGETVEVYTPLMLERLKEDEILLPRELVVAGIFETGWNQVDNNTIVTTLSLMQELYGLEQGIHGVSVKLRAGHDVIAIANELNETLDPPYQAFTWMDADRDLLFILKLEKTTMFFIIMFIIVVAAFSIASSLMTTVIRKTREIGLLGAMGARAFQVAAVFCVQGLLIGLTGTALGVVGAVSALHYRNGIVHYIAKITHGEEALLRYYQFSDIPVEYQMADFVIIILFSLVISTLAGFIPALRVARLKPSKALRSE